jgi:hypothetical protein
MHERLYIAKDKIVIMDTGGTLEHYSSNVPKFAIYDTWAS